VALTASEPRQRFQAPPRGHRHSAFLVGSVALHAAALAVALSWPARPAGPAVAVQIVAPLRPPALPPEEAAPAPPPPPPEPRRRPPPRFAPRLARAAPPAAPEAAAPPPAEAPSDPPAPPGGELDRLDLEAGGHGAQEGPGLGAGRMGDEQGAGLGRGAGSGLGGGAGPGLSAPASAPAPAPAPIAARPGDLAAVQAGVARWLVYPPSALRARWQGTALLAFVLRADGTVSALRVARSSGIAVLDQAALLAVERAAPFPPPGLDVRIEIPVSFRLA